MSETTELIAQQILNGNINKRTWGDILYNVKVYGAKGDWNTVTSTGTDDTAAIQATIDYAISVGGKAIFFPHGTYKVTALTNLSSVVLFGDNASFVGITDTINQIGAPTSNMAYNVKDFGAKGDGTTDDTIKIQAAINMAASGKLFFPPGTYIADNLVGISNIVIEGAGRDLVIIKRKNNAVGNNSILNFSGKTKFEVRGLTFDGNKANQVNASNSVTFASCGDWVFEDNRIINSKAISGGYGDGLVVTDGTNDTGLTTSRVENNWIENNDLDGFFLNREWNIAIRGNTFKNNGSGGLSVLNNTFPPVSDVSNGLIITENYAIGNTASGISVSGHVTGGTSAAPIYGSSVPPSRRVVIQGNICTGNGAYGIAYQGTNGSVIGNVCENNSRNVGYAGGILFNAEASTCIGNSTRDNKAYGIDAGASFYSVIANNQCMFEGAADNVSATYINVGASVGCIVEGNVIRMGGTQQHGGISYTGIDGDGATPFPTRGAYTSIKNNTIYCNDHASTGGIYVSRLAQSFTVTGNMVIAIVDNMRALIINDSNGFIKDNTFLTNGSPIGEVASAATLVIPDACETLNVTGTTNISKIMTYSENVFDGKVRDVQITNLGSGYSPTNKPTITFTGGGGAGAAATAEVDNGGTVIGVKMTNNGSGYTSAPTVSISGGVGTGATGTALIGANNHEGREISIIFQGALTVLDGQIALVGNLVTGTNNTVLKLRGAYGGWYEVSRAIN